MSRFGEVKHNNDVDKQAWYEKWFGREYLEVYSHRNDTEAVSDIEKIENLIPLRDAQPILDLACGSGRHSLEMARRGYKVSGIDLSATLLEIAKKSAEKEKLDIDFVIADMRFLPFNSRFGCVLNMFTSFGYFESDEQNSKIMKAIHKSLKSGGHFLIDYLNKELVLSTLVAEDEKEINGNIVIQNRRYNDKTQRLEKTIRVINPDSEKTFTESVRLYSAEELRDMAKTAGLEISRILGSLNGSDHSPSAPRTILVGYKLV